MPRSLIGTWMQGSHAVGRCTMSQALKCSTVPIQVGAISISEPRPLEIIPMLSKALLKSLLNHPRKTALRSEFQTLNSKPQVPSFKFHHPFNLKFHFFYHVNLQPPTSQTMSLSRTPHEQSGFFSRVLSPQKKGSQRLFNHHPLGFLVPL